LGLSLDEELDVDLFCSGVDVYEVGHDDLVASYFSTNPIYTDEMFCRRFRMNKSLLLCIVYTLSDWSPYFTQRPDATGRSRLSPLLKCTAAIRMLAYGTSA
jgi:hypothetical protein